MNWMDDPERRARLDLWNKASACQLNAAIESDSGDRARLPGSYELAARLYDDAAGYWEAHGGRSLEVGECRRLAQECRQKAEGR